MITTAPTRIAPPDTRCAAMNTAISGGRGRPGEQCRRSVHAPLGGNRLCWEHARRGEEASIPRTNRAKLTWDQVCAIRREVAQARVLLAREPGSHYRAASWEQEEYGVRTLTQIAAAYGVSAGAVSEIVAGKRYREPPRRRGTAASVRVLRRLTAALEQMRERREGA